MCFGGIYIQCDHEETTEILCRAKVVWPEASSAPVFPTQRPVSRMFRGAPGFIGLPEFEE